MAKIIIKTSQQGEPVRLRFLSTTIGRCFLGFVIAFEVLLIATTVMVGVWMGIYRDGFAWDEDDPQHQFNYHPLLIYIGFVFLYGNGMLVYRIFRSCRMIYLKVIHAIIQAAALILVGVGLKAVFDSHDNWKPGPIPHMYSLHSWLGLITVILFGLQWVVGFLVFLLPCAKYNLRAFMQPIHVYFGVMIFVFVIATSFAGMTEKLIFTGNKFDNGEKYSNFPPEGVFVNCLALFMGLILFIGVFLVADFDFRRAARQDENANDK